ncbi:MAG: hypothetical protein BV459_01495 [Thermoplasmata archaeon M11B2D]|nr:MAG: hypothetical protein BV459_01495 [Thermoplasmata archaeon M11B2D]
MAIKKEDIMLLLEKHKNNPEALAVAMSALADSFIKETKKKKAPREWNPYFDLKPGSKKCLDEHLESLQSYIKKEDRTLQLPCGNCGQNGLQKIQVKGGFLYYCPFCYLSAPLKHTSCCGYLRHNGKCTTDHQTERAERAMNTIKPASTLHEALDIIKKHVVESYPTNFIIALFDATKSIF